MTNADASQPGSSAFNDQTTYATTKRRCCLKCYDGNADANGWSWLAAGRGMMVMANIFISGSILWLASNEAGCFEDGKSTNEGSCNLRVHGFKPSSILTNIATIAGLLSAFFMPIFGAIVDFLPYRRLAGVITAIIITIIQGVQIYTVEDTWLIMAILQGFAAFFYQLQIVSVYAYLPDIAREVGHAKMTRFTSNFTTVQFAAQSFFIVIIAALGITLQASPVAIAQYSQGINTVTCIILFGIGWFKFMTPRPAARTLPVGHNLLFAGFHQNWQTAKDINKKYKAGLRWFFLALVFAEASAAAIITVSVIYLNDTLKLTPTEVSIFFLVTMVGSLPGTEIAFRVTSLTNPNTSWQLSMVALVVVLTAGVLTLDMLPMYCTFIWAFLVGMNLGWFYPTENLFFSSCLPRGQEAECAGFFVWCTQIFGWFPPLLFTIMMEAGVQQKYGAIVTSLLFLVAVGLLRCTGSWQEIIEECDQETAEDGPNHLTLSDNIS